MLAAASIFPFPEILPLATCSLACIYLPRNSYMTPWDLILSYSRGERPYFGYVCEYMWHSWAWFSSFRGRSYVCPQYQEIMSLIPAVRTLPGGCEHWSWATWWPGWSTATCKCAFFLEAHSFRMMAVYVVTCCDFQSNVQSDSYAQGWVLLEHAYDVVSMTWGPEPLQQLQLFLSSKAVVGVSSGPQSWNLPFVVTTGSS